MVAMTDGEPSPAYTIQPGTNIRLVSDYDASIRRLGAPEVFLSYCNHADLPAEPVEDCMMSLTLCASNWHFHWRMQQPVRPQAPPGRYL